MGRHKSKPADTGTASVLGERVRQLRTARGLTLKDLGAATGLSHGFLSQLERNLARPSISTLDDIAEALGTSAAALVSDGATGFANHVRRDEAPVYHFGSSSEPVTVRALTGRNALMKVTESFGSFPLSDAMAHPGEEVIYVIEGELEIEVGERSFVLREGDVLNFDCSVEHKYRAIGDAPPRILQIAADPGQYAQPLDETAYESRRASGNGASRNGSSSNGSLPDG